MCLQITHHTLRCDVRPVITLPTSPPREVVNPFQVPKACHCPSTDPAPQTILKCLHHGCCTLSSRFFPCGCGNIITYHNYIQRPASVEEGEGEGETERAAAAAAVPWRHIRTIDEDQQLAEAQAGNPQYHHPQASEELRIARRGMRWVG